MDRQHSTNVPGLVRPITNGRFVYSNKLFVPHFFAASHVFQLFSSSTENFYSFISRLKFRPKKVSQEFEKSFRFNKKVGGDKKIERFGGFYLAEM